MSTDPSLTSSCQERDVNDYVIADGSGDDGQGEILFVCLFVLNVLRDMPF